MGRKILVGDDGVEGRNNLVTCVMGFLAGMKKEFLTGMKKKMRDEYDAKIVTVPWPILKNFFSFWWDLNLSNFFFMSVLRS